MKREVRGTFSFECGQHKVPLKGEPFLVPPEEEPGYRHDLSEMTCPATSSDDIERGPDWCNSTWRVWNDAG